MADFNDAGHRDHARHIGETPVNNIAEGPSRLKVELDTWGPQDNLFTTMYDALQSNWGEEPMRSAEQPCREGTFEHNCFDDEWEHRTGWCRLTDGQRDYVISAFEGKTLPQILEMISFEFTITGTRAFTHQIVRTRVGAAFMQHGGRDNDWRHRFWIMPESIRRACVAHEPDHSLTGNPTGSELLYTLGLEHCITDWKPIDELCRIEADIHGLEGIPRLRDVIEAYLAEGRALYAALVDAGIPWQDARRVLWMGTETYIHAVYNYQALQGVIGKRGEHVMDWEINAISQLMMRELRMKCPPVFSKFLVPLSDKIGRDALAGLDSWTPTGKYENPHERCAVCGHAKGNHVQADDNRWGIKQVCEVCDRSGPVDPWHDYKPVDTRHRANRPEQNPFWVLAPSSLAGGPIKWIPTNGVYPHAEVEADKKEHGL
jgi:thymidylate synthase ThyX